MVGKQLFWSYLCRRQDLREVQKAKRVKQESMGKNSGKNRGKEEGRAGTAGASNKQQEKREAPWEDIKPLREFFVRKDALGAVSVTGRTPEILPAGQVTAGDTGLVTMNYKPFAHKHLELAREQQAEGEENETGVG